MRIIDKKAKYEIEDMAKLKGYPNPKPKAKVKRKRPKQKPVKLRTY